MCSSSATPRHFLGRRDVLGALGVVLAAGLAGLRPVHGQDLSPMTIRGTWRGVEQGPLGQMAVEVIFFPNGTYSRMHRWGDLLTRDVGSYSIVRNWIHFSLQSYNPTHYMGRPLNRPMSDTWVVEQFNGRFIRASVGGTGRVQIELVNR